MLETTPRATRESALIALEPRQVMLAKQQNMKNKKVSSETLENDSACKTLAVMLKSDKNKSNRDSSPQKNILLLRSIATYLDHHGFSKTLAAFQSEALIEELGGSKGHSLDLEEMYYKYLETNTHGMEEDINGSKELDLQEDGIAEKDKGESKCAASMESISKKKRKKSNGSDADMVNGQPGVGNGFIKCVNDSNEKLKNEVVPELLVKSKERKKKNKQVSDSPGENTRPMSSETFQELVDNSVSETQLDESDNKKDKKKKKNKSISESLAYNAERGGSEALPEVIEEKTKDSASFQGERKTDSAGILLDETNMKPKDKKKKKNKSVSDSLAENIEQGNSENINVKRKSKDLECSRGENEIGAQLAKSANENTFCEIPPDEKYAKSKDEKRKKNKRNCESSCGRDTKEFDRGYPKEIDSKNEDVPPLEESAVNIEKKGSKKRKRLASEENESQPDDNNAVKEAKQSKTEGSEEDRGRKQLLKTNAVLESDGNAGKKRKTENGQFDSNKSLEISLGNKANGHANGNLEMNGREGSAIKKSTKKQSDDSAEPKTVNAFQRVKVDQVEFADERLQNNSYWAKDGADVGYGAKAQEVLGQVRGRDFRHEKTKKKRGSYRGGQIDLQSHSIKFNYSDNE